MMNKFTICVLLCFELGSAFVLEPVESGGTLQLPTEYHFKVDDTSLNYGSLQQYEIWYSAKEIKSRKDTLGGLVRRYCRGDDVWQYTVHPKSTKELENKMVCSKSPDGKVINFLPYKNKFTPAGRATHNNKMVNVWKSSELYETEMRQDATLYVYRENGTDIPVLYQEKQVNLWNGVVDSYTITRYYDFQAPKPEDLVYEKEDECEWRGIENLKSQLEDIQAHDLSHLEEVFKRYKDDHYKIYDEDEENTRKHIFKQNWRLIKEHNNKNLSFKMGLNKFSDRMPSELAHLTSTLPAPRFLSSDPFPFTAQQLEELADDLPENYDMRMDGVISVIKNLLLNTPAQDVLIMLLHMDSNVIDQAECGSCWAFSTVAAVEGALAKKNYGRDLDLSEQSLIDCSWGYGNLGCDGGYLPGTFQYLLKNGIPTEKEYGLYSGEDGVCHLKNMTDFYKIRSFAAIPPLSVNATKAALYHFGPVVVTINAKDDLKYYYSGIYYDKNCNKGHINHAVTIVGYGVRDGEPYWIVKNTWGEDWGEDGYILFSAKDSICHILEEPYCPIV